LANVTFGQQGPFNLAFSTGAVRAWVVGEDAENIKSGVHIYYPDDSDTSKDLQKTFTQYDGTYTTTAEWFTDLMQFGKAKIKAQAFGVATKIDEDNDNVFPVDGVFGVNHLIPDAYSKTNGEPTAPIDNLLRPLIKKTVSVYLAKQVSPSKGSAQGTVTIGGFDKTHCDGSSAAGAYSLTYQTSSDNRWVASASNLQFGNYYSSASGYAYFDTGVSTLQLPSADLQQIYDQILPDYDWDTGLYVVDCKQASNLGSIAISLSPGGSYVQVSASSYVVDLNLDDGVCALSLGVVGDDNSAEQYVFGTPLFREYCVAFDFENNQILTYYHATN